MRENTPALSFLILNNTSGNAGPLLLNYSETQGKRPPCISYFLANSYLNPHPLLMITVSYGTGTPCSGLCSRARLGSALQIPGFRDLIHGYPNKITAKTCWAPGGNLLGPY